MYKIWLINFQYFLEKEYSSIEEGVEGMKKTGFQSSLHYNGTMVAAFCPIAGVNYYAN